MEQRKLSDQANTLVDLSKASSPRRPLGSARLPRCFSSRGKANAELADRGTLRLGREELPWEGRRRNRDTNLTLASSRSYWEESRGPRRVGLGDPQRSLPTPTIL